MEKGDNKRKEKEQIGFSPKEMDSAIPKTALQEDEEQLAQTKPKFTTTTEFTKHGQTT